MLVENLKKNYKEIDDIGLYCYSFLEGAKESDRTIINKLYKIINNATQKDDLSAIEELIAGLKSLIIELNEK